MRNTALAIKLPPLEEQMKRFFEIMPGGSFNKDVYNIAKNNTGSHNGPIILPSIKGQARTGRYRHDKEIKDPYGVGYRTLVRHSFEWSCGRTRSRPNWDLLDGRFGDELRLDSTYAEARKEFESNIHTSFYVVPVTVGRLYEGVNAEGFTKISLTNWQLPLCLLDYSWLLVAYPELMESLQGQKITCPADVHYSNHFMHDRYSGWWFDDETWCEGRDGEVDVMHNATNVFTIPRNSS